MAFASHLNSFCDWLRTQISVPVVLGRPDKAGPGIYIWPWRVVASPQVRNLPSPGPHSAKPQSLNVHFLLLTPPAISPQGLANLESALQAIYQHPVFNAAGAQFQVLADTGISVEDLTSVFIAAKLELTPCFAYVLQDAPSQT